MLMYFLVSSNSDLPLRVFIFVNKTQLSQNFDFHVKQKRRIQTKILPRMILIPMHRKNSSTTLLGHKNLRLIGSKLIVIGVQHNC